MATVTSARGTGSLPGCPAGHGPRHCGTPGPPGTVTQQSESRCRPPARTARRLGPGRHCGGGTDPGSLGPEGSRVAGHARLILGAPGVRVLSQCVTARCRLCTSHSYRPGPGAGPGPGTCDLKSRDLPGPGRLTPSPRPRTVRRMTRRVKPGIKPDSEAVAVTGAPPGRAGPDRAQ